MLWREGLLGFTTTIQCSAELYYLPCCSALQYRSAAYRSSTFKSTLQHYNRRQQRSLLDEVKQQRALCWKEARRNFFICGKINEYRQKNEAGFMIYLSYTHNGGAALLLPFRKGHNILLARHFTLPWHTSRLEILMKTTQRKKITWSRFLTFQSFSPRCKRHSSMKADLLLCPAFEGEILL